MGKQGFTSLLFPLAILLIVAAPTPGAGQAVSPPATPCPNLGFNPSLVPFDTSDLLCTKVWSQQDFLLQYKYNSARTTWSFVLSAPSNNSYIGIGFSETGRMGGSSAVVGWPVSGGTGKAKQYYLGGFTPALCEPDKGNLTLVKGTPVLFSEASRLYLAFQLNTTKDGPSSKLIYAVGPPGFVPEPDNLLAPHSSKINTTITYVTGSPAPASSPTNGPIPSPTNGPTTSPTKGSPSPPPQGSRAHRVTLGRLSMATIPIIATLLAMSLF